ncbi:MAG: gliding motility protein GldL [Bacteroidetes bacterium]|nr:gliding motility protein GldL [Bacteroidota bacterium]
MAKLYGLGASVVLVGALFKIQHWEGAGIMLTIGLLTEAVIFFFSAFEPLHEETDWSLVYPELAGMHDPSSSKDKKKKADPVAQALDKMLSDAKVGPDLIASLGTGLKTLGENTAKMSDLSNASVATNEYVKNVSAATKSVGELSVSYQKASQAMSSLSTASDDVKMYNEQVQLAGKNLGALNAVYELQLQDSNSHLKQTSKFYDGINQLMANLNESLDDTKKYKDEVSKLAKNLSSLNTVYGNMLSAMNLNPNK